MVLSSRDELQVISYRLGVITRYLSIVEFGDTFGLYSDDFLATPKFSTLSRHIHRLNSLCWSDISEDKDDDHLDNDLPQPLIAIPNPLASHSTTATTHLVTLNNIYRTQQQ
ncbi:hypothetical protein PVK06_008495 [Gossypium arboreum]|uniref:Uncharacterized protein n=1 Tax=Gossypium arboreum TaxID=29729 RepID=A0ABR0QKA3_GOSAR|nr:hypothetical protein PVK06_008495 [Gossypium arboreum]